MLSYLHGHSGLRARVLAWAPSLKPTRRHTHDNRDPDANYALSDFDRTHRFAGSFVWTFPAGFRLSGYGQIQSSVPYFDRRGRARSRQREPVLEPPAGVGWIVSTRVRPPEPVRQSRRARAAGVRSDGAGVQCRCALLTLDCRRGVPGNRGFGNLGRNVLRASYQKRLDLMLAKSFTFGSRMLEVRWDVFNVLNWVNFAVPNNVIGDAGTDSGSTSASNRYSQRPTIRSVFERDPHPETAPRFNPDRSYTRGAPSRFALAEARPAAPLIRVPEFLGNRIAETVLVHTIEFGPKQHLLLLQAQHGGPDELLLVRTPRRASAMAATSAAGPPPINAIFADRSESTVGIVITSRRLEDVTTVTRHGAADRSRRRSSRPTHANATAISSQCRVAQRRSRRPADNA